MDVIESVDLWREIFGTVGTQVRSVGLVPTMGALHAGHMSLVERSVRENDVTAVTVFVNPAQFDNPEDLASYPDIWGGDRLKLEASGVDYVLRPAAEDLYPDGYRYRVMETEVSLDRCGAARPGHFTGVLTVVMKLLNATGADRAYFGEKDWQQYELIAGMADAFMLSTEIVGCPIVRDSDGLALSSRNLRLTPDQRRLAPAFHRILSSGITVDAMIRELETSGFSVDYVESRDGRIFGAVFLGDVRLIDNVPQLVYGADDAEGLEVLQDGEDSR